MRRTVVPEATVAERNPASASRSGPNQAGRFVPRTLRSIGRPGRSSRTSGPKSAAVPELSFGAIVVASDMEESAVAGGDSRELRSGSTASWGSELQADASQQ